MTGTNGNSQNLSGANFPNSRIFPTKMSPCPYAEQNMQPHQSSREFNKICIFARGFRNRMLCLQFNPLQNHAVYTADAARALGSTESKEESLHYGCKGTPPQACVWYGLLLAGSYGLEHRLDLLPPPSHTLGTMAYPVYTNGPLALVMGACRLLQPH